MLKHIKPILKKALAYSLVGSFLCNQIPYAVTPVETLANTTTSNYLGSSFSNTGQITSYGNTGNAHTTAAQFLLRMSAVIETEEDWQLGYDEGNYPATKAFGLFMGKGSSITAKNIAWTDVNVNNAGTTQMARVNDHPAVSFNGTYNFSDDYMKTMASSLYTLITQKMPSTYKGDLTAAFAGDTSYALGTSHLDAFIFAMQSIGVKETTICEILSLGQDTKVTDSSNIPSTNIYGLRISTEDRDSILDSETGWRTSQIDFTGAYIATFFKYYQDTDGNSKEFGSYMDEEGDTILNIFTGRTEGYQFNICLENEFAFYGGGVG